MNKKRAFLISFTIIVLLLNSYNYVYGRDSHNLESDRKMIESLIKDYLTSKYESLATFSTGNIECYFDDTDLYSRKQSKSERDKLTLLVDWRKSRNLRLAEYNLDLDFREIRLANNKATALVVENASYRYVGHRVISRLAGLEHTFKLKKVHDQWKILSDQYEDEITYAIKNSGKTITELIAAIPDINKKINGRSSSRAIVPQSTGFYDWGKAIEYADRYWSKDITGYNTSYVDFTTMGGDCTNYVSQCLRAGGAPNDTSGSLVWYYRNAGGSTYDDTWSSSWNNVQPLQNY